MCLSIILGIIIIVVFYYFISQRKIIILDGDNIDKIQKKKIKEGDKCFVIKPKKETCKKK